MEQTKRRKNAPGAGRPAIKPHGKNVMVYLHEDDHKKAAEIGNGNVSAGVREALRKYVDK